MQVYVLYTVIYQYDQSAFKYRPLSVVGLRRKLGPVILTWTAWVQFLPSPTHETCLCCSAVSGLMKLACLRQHYAKKHLDKETF